MLETILMVFALVLLLLAAFNVSPPNGRPALGWLGLAFWAAAILLAHVR